MPIERAVSDLAKALWSRKCGNLVAYRFEDLNRFAPT